MSELSKAEAIAYLGISEKTLERYVRKHRVSVRYENTQHGRQPFFKKEELELLKQSRNPSYSPAIAGELATISISQEEKSLLGFWAQASAHTLMVQRLNYQLTLTLNEAAMLSGFSKTHLLEAAKLGSLNARKIKRKWKVRTEDLKEYVDGLFGGDRV